VFVPFWLRNLQARLRSTSSQQSRPLRRAKLPAVASVDRLENRMLLTVIAFADGLDLTIQADQGESISVQHGIGTGNVEVLADGLPISAQPAIASSDLQTLTIVTDDFDDDVNLAGLSAAQFTSLTAITIDTGDGNDMITGSDDFGELIMAGDGADTVFGGGGDDTINGQDGDDSLDGGAGRDEIKGGDGNDTLIDLSVDPTLLAGQPDNILQGGDGDDLITAGPGNESILGNSGMDVIDAGDGNDTVDGGSGNDDITGGIGADVLNGGSDDDTISGGNGADTIDGDSGRDSLLGDAGDDSINGGRQKDTLLGGAGNDTLAGDHDDDVLSGEAGNDFLRGGAGDDNIDGNDGDDTLRGQGGNDTVVGGFGSDDVDGGAGDDLIDSGDFDALVDVAISISDAPNVTEGSIGAVTDAVFTVSLSIPFTQTVTVDYVTASGSATAGVDFSAVPTPQTLVFTPGMVSLNILVPVLGDGMAESDENFFVRISNATNGFITDSEGTTFIVNDDGWVAAGPAPANNGQSLNITPNGEISGAVQGIATHPTNPDIAYIGTVNGGIWKTTDATSLQPTWVPQTDFLPSLSIGDIAFDPSDPTGQTLVAGIGRSSSLAAVGGPSTGILRTTDGGDTWTEISPAILQGETILRVTARGNILMAASDNRWTFRGGNGLFRSTDGGVTFTAVSGAGSGLPAGPVSDLQGDPSNPSRFYAAVRQTGIFRSDDSGATWVNVTGSVTGISAATENVFLAVHATATDNVVYAVIGDGNGGWTQLFRSADQGASWAQLDSPSAAPAGVRVHGAFTADPANPNLVYIGGSAEPNTLLSAIRVDASQSSGAQVTSIVGANANNTQPHADSRRLAFSADGSLIAAVDGGLVRLSSPQTSNGSWTSMNGNLQTIEAHDTVYDPIAQVIIIGTQDNGTIQQSSSGSLVWDRTFGGDGGDVAVDTIQLAGQNQSLRYSSAQNLGGFHVDVYDASNNRISRTTLPLTVTGNGAAIVPQFVTPIATNAVAGNRLIIGGSNSTYESTDGGLTVTEVGVGVGVNSLGFDPIAYGGTRGGVPNPDVLYVGSGAQVFVRTAAGGMLAATASAFPGGGVRDIVLDPADWMRAWVVGVNGVFSTTNAGNTWTNETGNLTASLMRTVEYVGGPSPAIVVGAQEGVFRMQLSASGAWNELSPSSLPNAQVWELDYDPASDLLVAGTMGRGVWTFPNASLGEQINNPVPGIGGIINIASLGDTLLGDDGNDTVIGGGGNDFMDGGSGNDLLNAGSGDDLVLGGSGNDTLDGGAGNDTLDGEAGNDILNGGSGVNEIRWSDGGDGIDRILESIGSDTLTIQGSDSGETYNVSSVGGAIQVAEGSGSIISSRRMGLVQVLTGDGDDTVTITSLVNVLPIVLVIDGQAGDDTISATNVVLPRNLILQLNGGDGDDLVIGSSSRDRIDGGLGDDTLRGEPGDDSILGGDGNDSVEGGGGNDTIDGGLGADTLLGEVGDDSLEGGFGDDFLDGDDGNDTVSGGFGNDLVRGDRGDDLLYGGQGDDSLFGSAGNDSMDGGDGDDKVRGGGGDDVLKGGDGNDNIQGDDGADTIDAGDGNDRVEAGHGLNVVFGGDGNDRLIGGKNEDTLIGGDGDDSLFGRNREDVLFGDDGDDLLDGDGDRDKFNSGEGNDVLRSMETREVDSVSLALPASVRDALIVLNGF
jgi:Ca2+-binding RTX toxin-like protein